jgi:hypothetical protein
MICDKPRAPLLERARGLALDSAQISERMYEEEILVFSAL